MIIQNTIKCNKCEDVITSTHVHDFKWCSCKSVACDGGKEYLKRTGEDYTEMATTSMPVMELWEIKKLLILSLEALNYIKNQKVIVSGGYDVKDTYEIASMISKYLKDEK